MAATHSLDLESSSSQYASIADASCPNLEISGSQTYEGWIKTESTGTNKVIVAKGKASTAIYHQLAVNSSTEQLDVYIVGLTTNDFLRSNTVIQTGVWYHVAGVYDSSAGKLRIYINGELDKEVTAGGTASDTNSNFAIGCNFSGGSDAAASFFDGLLRNVRVWNVARTQAQIRADMNVDTPSVTTGLQGNWILNNAYTDSSGNGYTLTASGSPTFSTTYPDAIDLVENGTFTKKHKITIDNTKVSGSADLTDVPVVFTESNFLADAFSNSLNGGADIRFSTDINGKIRLAHEIVTWNTGTSTAEVHVKVNTLSYNTDTDIYVHYNNSSATAIDENEAFGKHQVWGENWEGVWHLNEASGTRMDASKNSNDLTDNNTVGAGVGKIGTTAASMVAANSEYLSITHAAQVGLEITGSQTWMIWHKATSFVDSRIMDKLTNSRSIGIFAGGNVVWWTAGLTDTSISLTGVLTVNQWDHIVAMYDSANSKIKTFINGSKTEEASSGTLTASTSNFTIGALNTGASNFINGLADEARIYNGALSDDYIATLYNNQNSPSTFATASAVGNTSAFFMFL